MWPKLSRSKCHIKLYLIVATRKMYLINFKINLTWTFLPTTESERMLQQNFLLSKIRTPLIHPCFRIEDFWILCYDCIYISSFCQHLQIFSSENNLDLRAFCSLDTSLPCRMMVLLRTYQHFSFGFSFQACQFETFERIEMEIADFWHLLKQKIENGCVAVEIYVRTKTLLWIREV